MALGEAFSPSAQNQNDPTLKRRRTPVQQALQTVSLQPPAYAGPSAVSNRLISGQGGAAPVAAMQGQPALQAFMNALTGGRTKSTASGFAGGGFGPGGPVAGAGAVGSAKWGAPGSLPSTPGAMPGGMKLPYAELVRRAKAAGQKAMPGGMQLPPGFQLPPALAEPPGGGSRRPYEAPEPGDPGYINPNIPGGGLLDHLVSPPVNFAGGGGPTFNTPTGGFAGAGTAQPPAPPSRPVYTQPPTQYTPYGYGPGGHSMAGSGYYG